MIRSIELANFKCFEYARIGLGAITLATGLNGSGKSSLFQSLLLLHQSHAQGLLRDGKLALNGELVQLGAGHDAFHEFAEEDVIRIGLSWVDDVIANWEFAYDKSADVLTKRSASVADGVFERPPMGGDLHYLTADRVGPRATFPMSDYAVEHRLQLGQRGEYAPHFLAHFGRTRVQNVSLHHPQADTDLLLSQVEAWLGEVSPGVRLQARTHRTLDAAELSFSFAGPHGRTADYRPMNVGFGLTYALSVIIAALAARPGALLLIDSPEAHLHPRGQVKVTELLARAAATGVQVVIETHSDHVLNGLRIAVHGGALLPEAAAIHYFERRVTSERIYHAVTSPKIDADGRIEPWPSGFFDEMEIALERLLQPREERQ